MKTIVRTGDRMTFEIDPRTLDAKECSYYDAYCFMDPLPNVKYIDYTDWVQMRNRQWDKAKQTYYRCKE